MTRHTPRHAIWYTHGRLARAIVLTAGLLLAGAVLSGCQQAEDFLDTSREYESPRKRPTVPLKRTARWQDVDCFGTFPSFKRAMKKRGHGRTGDSKSWHHIVAQHAGNKKKFTEHDLHCTDNLVYIHNDDHKKLNSMYSKKDKRWGNKSLRDHLRPMSFDDQYAHGIMALDQLKVKHVFVR